MGHNNDETPLTHYGRRENISTGVVDIELPIPDEAEVAQVRIVAIKLEALSKLHERDETGEHAVGARRRRHQAETEPAAVAEDERPA